ncbi:MAG: CoA transferase [Chloroflexota bacterium]|nr:CoA transferase [Chloroflexota bacterium]
MGALDGIRVIDFGQYVAGPLAAVMLADQGADVIHVDPPGGPRWKDPSEAFYNRGKRRIVLDLKQQDDLSVARRLVESADVVIENFRPGAMDRLTLGAAAMTQRLPGLVYCSIPGFASDDPRSGVAAWEGVVAAATDTYALAGQLFEPGDPRLTDPDRPVYTALPLASNFAAFHAATAIVMALIARQRGGAGQRIEVPMFDAMFELIGANGISVDGDYRMKRTRRTHTFPCADGRRIYFNSGGGRFLLWFARAAGVSDWAADGLLDPLRLEREPDLQRAFRERLAQLFLTKPAEEWEALINHAGGPTTMVRSAAEWLANEHARQRRTVMQLDDPELGPTWMPGIHVHQTDSPSVVRGPRRAPNADRETILNELETWTAVRPAVRSPGTQMPRYPLEGLEVLDLTQVVAGPCTGRILVEYGANVIKINNPSPEMLTAAVSLSGRMTDPGNQQHEHLNRGKQSVLLDLHSQHGLRVFWRLVEQADVLMQNFAMGQAQRYGISYEQARTRNPKLLYFSLSAYGYGGPMESYRGFEPNAQAVAGLMHRFGGDGLPMAQPYLLDDYGTGIRGAFAIALGLYHRQRTGRGQHIDISLAETATYHEAPFLLEHTGKVWNEPKGTDALGSGPLQRLYRASDAWFFLGAGPEDRWQLPAVEGLEGTAGLAGSTLEQTLEMCLAREPVDVWIERLRSADIGAHALARVEDLMQDAWVRSHGLSLTQNIEGVGNMVMPGVAARLSRTPLRVGDPVHPVGSDGPEVLRRVGLAQQLDDAHPG